MDFREISQKHSRDDDKQKCVRLFWYLKYFSSGIHLRNTSHIFLATPTLDAVV